MFKSTIKSIEIYPGDPALSFYIAKNKSSEAITGISTYHVTPAKAGIYFNKIQCFCFEEQRLKGNESIEMPVLYFIDSDFNNDPKMQDVESITLSYTFYKA
jgi:cytochrome c oxidase assembly protein subunit 11